jgi:hypothetical protein
MNECVLDTRCGIDEESVVVIRMTLLFTTFDHSGEMMCHSDAPFLRGPICRFAEQSKMSLPFRTCYVLRTRETSEYFAK